MMSFKDRADIFTYTPPVLPTTWVWSNYQEVLSQGNVPTFFWNSLKISVATTVINLFFATTCAYGIARVAGTMSRQIANGVLLLRMVPGMVMTIPYYLVYKQMNLIDNHWALILAYAALSSTLGIWLCLGFYRNIPEEIYEAGMVDGCTEIQMFTKIAFPLIANSIVVVALNVFFFAWNEFTMAILLLSKTEIRTLSVGIRYLISDTLELPYARIAATGVIAILPTILATIFMQNYMVKGFVAGAIKG